MLGGRENERKTDKHWEEEEREQMTRGGVERENERNSDEVGNTERERGGVEGQEGSKVTGNGMPASSSFLQVLRGTHIDLRGELSSLLLFPLSLL